MKCPWHTNHYHSSIGEIHREIRKKYDLEKNDYFFKPGGGSFLISGKRSEMGVALQKTQCNRAATKRFQHKEKL